MLMQQKIQYSQNYGYPMHGYPMHGGSYWNQPPPHYGYQYYQQPPPPPPPPQYNYANMSYPNQYQQQYPQNQQYRQYDPMMGEINNPFANSGGKGNWDGQEQRNNKMNESKGQGNVNMGGSRFGGSWAKNSTKWLLESDCYSFLIVKVCFCESLYFFILVAASDWQSSLQTWPELGVVWVGVAGFGIIKK